MDNNLILVIIGVFIIAYIIFSVSEKNAENYAMFDTAEAITEIAIPHDSEENRQLFSNQS